MAMVDASAKANGKNAVHWVSRLLLSAIFIGAGMSKLKKREGTLDYMASKGMPRSGWLLNGAIAMELGVAPAVALGLVPRLSASALAAFLVPTAVIFHDFWNVEEAQSREMETINFLKDLAIAGGLIHLAMSDVERARSRQMRTAEPMGMDRPDYLDQAA
jgi:putative oxidoreductase